MSLKSLSNKFIAIVLLLNQALLWAMTLDLPLTKIEQVAVPAQNTAGSCAYHAIYNGMRISSDSAITETELRQYCETQQSPWATHTVAYRARLLAQYYLHDMLLLNLKNARYVKRVKAADEYAYKLNLRDGYAYLKTDSAELQTEQYALARIITEVANKLAARAVQNGDVLNYTITPDDITNEFLREIERRKDTSVETIELYGDFTADKIALCLPALERLQFSIQSDNIVRNASGDHIYVMDWRSRKVGTESTTRPGEWLNSTEIQRIIDSESEEGSLASDDTSFHTLDDNYEEILSKEESFLDLSKHIQSNKAVSAVILVYACNHWFVIVVDKKEQTKPCFKIADSLNINRLQNARTLSILSKLTGRVVPNISSNYVIEAAKDLPPLDMLVESERLLWLRTVAARIRNKSYPPKGVLLTGPSGTGKFSIALNIAALTNCSFIAVQAADLTAGNVVTQEVDSYNEYLQQDEEDSWFPKSAKSRTKSLFKVLQNYPKLILFIYNVEDLIEDQEYLAQFVREFLRFKRFINNAVYLMGSTSNPEAANNPELLKLMDTLRINLPSKHMVEKILRYYCSKYLDTKCTEPNLFLDQIATICRNSSGADIKDLVKNVAACIEDKTPNGDAWLFFMRLGSHFDFRNDLLKACCAIAELPLLAIMEAVDNRNRNTADSYFYALCKAKKNITGSETQAGDLLLKLSKLACIKLTKFGYQALVYIISPDKLDLPSKLFNLAITGLTQTKTGNVVTNMGLNAADAFLKSKSNLYKKTQEGLATKLDADKARNKASKTLKKKKQLRNLIDEAKRASVIDVIKEAAACEADIQMRKFSELYRTKKEKEENNGEK